MEQNRLARMTGNQPLMVSMYTTKLLVRGAHKIYGEEQNIAGSTDANMCTVRRLNLFEHQSEETQLAAIFLQFDPPHFLEDASLYLSFFLRGKSRAITDFASFLKAMEGLEEFLVVFYRWEGVLDSLMRQLRLDLFDGYDVAFVAAEVYKALHAMHDLAMNTTFETRLPFAEYRQMFQKKIEAIRALITQPNEFAFKNCIGNHKILAAGPCSIAPDSPPATSRSTPTQQDRRAAKVNTPAPSHYVDNRLAAPVGQHVVSTSELCIASLKHHYGLTRPVPYGAPRGSKGPPFDACRAGDKCTRIHYEQVKANTITKLIAVRQCTNVVKKEPDTLAMLVGHVNSDPLFL
jgi:hypothetical protein